MRAAGGSRTRTEARTHDRRRQRKPLAEMTPRAVALALLGVALVGCAAATAPGSRYQLTERQPWGTTTVQWLTPCNPNPSVGAVTCNVMLTDNPTDAEAWLFEARLKIYWSGIPVGREPQDYFVTGDRAHCETVRANMRTSTLWSNEREVPPTEPCTGPFYFKRELPAPTQ